MLIGKRIYGRYKLVRMIGGGGMANVYLAQDMILEREVAVKILRMDFNNDEEFIKRFNREAQSATSLYHPNIVSIYDVGEEDDIYFIVMEYVKGLTLKQYIQQHQHIPVEKTLDIMQQITSAISHAHQHGIIHRDIKPQNILVDEEDHVKITDFGIATALSATSITQTNAVLGSVHYLSPEQARGGMANKKSDIYSLGIVMFELLTGRLPFSGESAVSIALKHLQSSTPSPKRWNPHIPQSVENVVLKAMAKDSFHRYENVEEMKADLMTALSPDRINEKPFIIPEDMDATKAIPVITEDTVIPEHGETIIVNSDTQEYQQDFDEDDDDDSQEEVIIHKPKASSPKVKKVKPAKTKKVKVKEKKPKGKLIKGILITVIILAIMSIVAFFTLPRIMEPPDVEIPNVQGENVNDAIAILLEKNFKIKTHEVSDEEIEENKVIKTNPEAGRLVKEGKEIDIYVSKGKKTTKMTDFENRHLDDVVSTIETLGFKDDYVINEVNSDDYEAGMVIDQDPSPDTDVIPSETTVHLTVSKGPSQITLKDLSEFNQRMREDYENETGLRIKVNKEIDSETVAEGLVVDQWPRPYAKVDKGSTVQVVLSKGKKELPPKIVKREIVIPYEPDPLQPGKPQEVQIYIEDMNRSMTEPADVFKITENVKKTIELTIPPDGKAGYKIIRDNSVIDDEAIPYE
ncbi:Stk1 family PASTA domain-containing Ser/Thr kinase [Bacillus sp. JJ722]|uniref:Stk1 family PASTA domain-containing Ser/Thr kinase n=1 Tax=Bacillus sp. JJ722 TaxID=3122973 RepID=UPI002FFDB284